MDRDTLNALELDDLLRRRPGDTPVDGPGLFVQLLGRPAWHDHAACRGMGPDRFFPAAGHSSRDGLDVCQTCPVTAECLDAALDTGAVGVWGNTTQHDRRKLRRRAA